MNSEALLLQEQEMDTSSTALENPPKYRNKPRSVVPSQVWVLPNDISTAHMNFTLAQKPISHSTPALTNIFPHTIPLPPLDLLVEVNVYFPPKKTRTVKGLIVRRERAKFKTAFGDELAELISEP